MNLYRIWYSYTVPTEDHPEVEVCGADLYVDIEGEFEAYALERFKEDSYLAWTKDNLKVVDCKLIEKDIHLLKRVEINDVTHVQGVAGSFTYSGKEIVIVARDIRHLKNVYMDLYKEYYPLDLSKVKDVNISLQDDNNKS
jgi:hypothetical protein